MSLLSLGAVQPPTYPARPINGGRLELAPPKPGQWFDEPKYNGWRALVHVPTGAMFNRRCQPLSITGSFSAALKRLRPKTEELRASLQSLIGYYSENAGRMRYDEYLRLGYGIGSGAVESAHKQVVHARLRQAGMRWSEAGARRLLALRLLLLNGDWALLDRMRMVSLA